MSAEDRAQGLKECHDTYAKDPHDPEIACVLDHDGNAIFTCLSALDGNKQPRKTEAQLRLAKLARNLKVYFITNGAYPTGRRATPRTRTSRPSVTSIATASSSPIRSTRRRPAATRAGSSPSRRRTPTELPHVVVRVLADEAARHHVEVVADPLRDLAGGDRKA